MVKHGKTDSADVALRMKGDHVVLTVEDHGAGFEPESGMADASGFGLFGIQERVPHLGGVVIVHSQPGRGTRVSVAIPPTRIEHDADDR